MIRNYTLYRIKYLDLSSGIAKPYKLNRRYKRDYLSYLRPIHKISKFLLFKKKINKIKII